MKLMIASDIHGSAFYCKQLIEAYKQEQPDKLLLLGDLLYHGPRNDLPKDYAPKQVIEMLNAISDQLICVRGNCEAEVDQMVLNFPVLSESCILYIDGQTIYATHGHINSPANPPKSHKGDILLTGQEQPDKLLLLGDLLYHGPRNDLPKDYAPKQVIEMLNAISDQLICVRGNCEAEVDQMVLNFPVLSESCILYIDGQTIYATHGHINSPANPPKSHKGDILLTGHTHIPAWEEYDNFLYLNPGSVSIPKEGSEHGYMIYEDKTFLWKTLKGDVYHTL